MGRGLCAIGVFGSVSLLADPPDAPSHPHAYTHAKVHVMAPLRVVDTQMPGWENHGDWNVIKDQTHQAAKLGITSVAKDFWWGMIQAKGPNRETDDWSYFDHYVSVIEKVNEERQKEGAAPIQIDAVASAHQCGGNVGDNVYIPTPQFHRDNLKATAEHPDLAYVSEAGNRTESASVWGTKYVIGDYEGFWRAFRDHYGPKAHLFSKIIIGMGEAGEAVYPSYHLHDRAKGVNHAHFPGRGVFQFSSDLAQNHLREFLKARYGTLDKLNDAWKREGAQRFASWDKVQALTTVPEVDKFFHDNQQYTQMGQDVTECYHQSLIDSVLLKARRATEIFHAPGSPFKNVPLAFKIPGIHWRFQDRSPQIAAGLISTKGSNPSMTLPVSERQPADWRVENGGGYRGFFEGVFLPLRKEFPGSKWMGIFTCGEMPNCPATCLAQGPDANCKCCSIGGPVYSQAQTLVRGMGHLAKEFKVFFGLENALAGNVYDDASMARLEEHLQSNPWFVEASLLRQYDVLNSPPARGFVQRIQQLDRVELSCPEKLVVLNDALTP